MPKDNKKESDKSASGSQGLSDSPYIGGRKMSTRLKDKLKYIKRCNIPFPRPPASSAHVRSNLFKKLAREYSKEEIEYAMNAPEVEMDEDTCSSAQEIDEDACSSAQEINEDACSSAQEIEEVIISDDVIEENEMSSFAPKEDLHKKVGSELIEFVEGSVEMSCPDENGTDTSFLNDVDKSEAKINVISFTKESFINDNDGSDFKIKDEVINASSFTKESFINGKDGSDFKIKDEASSSSKDKTDNCIDGPDIKVNEDICAYSKEDIEKCVDKESVLEIFRDLEKEYAENQEKLRKLQLVQKHHTKNSPEALKSLNQKWLTCTQLALRKLYHFMPEPRSITFENFLIFLQVDFQTVKYNPETDSFA